jgi:alkylation response protein AidB-like acyl-CoA dehydrogenase
MDFRFSPEDEALRKEAMEFTRKEWDNKGYGDGAGIYYALSWHHEDKGLDKLINDFEKKLARKGWFTMHWPTEFGGQAAGITRQMAYREAMSYAGAPASLGGGLVAPVLMVHGSDWQKEYFLPKIANAEFPYISQGFSEPDAGSDLASLKTRAVRDGDDYVINGQKIWSTYRAPWMHILVRTDPDAPKHRGITYLLMPLKDDRGQYLPGVTVRAIPDAFGRHRWDELFLENVRVPANNIIGEENKGWYAAMTTLSFERSNIEGPAMLIRIIEQFIDWAKSVKRRAEEGPLDSRIVKHQIANLRLEVEAMRMLSYRVGWMQSRGEIPQKEASMTKFWGDELTQKTYRTLSRIMGQYGVLLPGNKKSIPLPLDGYFNYNAAMSGTISIAGGTTEVQKNIIAQRGLGLPR